MRPFLNRKNACPTPPFSTTPLHTCFKPHQDPSVIWPEERVPYTTIQYNTASYLLQTTPRPFRHMEGYIQHIMEQGKLPGPLARTILYDILENEPQPNDPDSPPAT